jgi:peptidoglycan hydrolase-like protein with peptidoglycan-binding domain
MSITKSVDESLMKPTDATLDVRTTVGLQTALTRLGYNVGAIDGIPRPKTRAGVTALQRDQGLVVDGIYGRRSLRGSALSLRLRVPRSRRRSRRIPRARTATAARRARCSPHSLFCF